MRRLVNERVSALWDLARDQFLIQRLGRAITAILKGDRRWRVEEVGEEVESCLDRTPHSTGRLGTGCRGGIELCSTVRRYPLGLNSRESRRSGWTSTDMYHHRGRITPYRLSPSQWTT